MANLVQIEKHLKTLGIKYKIIDLGSKIFRVEQVITAGVNPSEIVKTLIIKTIVSKGASKEPSGAKILRSSKNVSFLALVVRGQDRIDFKKARNLFGSNNQLAKPDEVLKIVGVPVGAVCPILIDVPVIFDQNVLNLTRVNLGSGDLTCGLEMDLRDLLSAVGPFQVKQLV